jgi:hypothetical protein
MRTINKILRFLDIRYKISACPKDILVMGETYVLPLSVKFNGEFSDIIDKNGKKFFWQPEHDEKVNLLVRAINLAAYNSKRGV